MMPLRSKPGGVTVETKVQRSPSSKFLFFETGRPRALMLCPRIERSGGGGILFYRLAVCTNLTGKLNIFLLLLNKFTYKAHIWYEGISHQYASAGTKFKVICKVKVKYKGYISQKMAFSGAFVFHKYILFGSSCELYQIYSYDAPWVKTDRAPGVTN